MVTRIVPATAHILRTGGSRIAPRLLDRSIVRHMSCCTCQCIGVTRCDILTLNCDPRTVLIEIIQGIVQHSGVDPAVSDGELSGRGTIGRFDMIGTGRIQSGKVDHMHAVTGIRIGTQHFRSSAEDLLSAGIHHIKSHPFALGGKQGRLLGSTDKIAHLIGQHSGTLPWYFLHIVILIRRHIVQRHIVKGDHRPRREAVTVRILAVAPQMECPLRNIQTLVCRKRDIHLFRLICPDLDRIPGRIQIIAVAHIVPDLDISFQIADLGIVLAGIGRRDLILYTVLMSRNDL